jgi:hypothetical protein
MDNEQIKNTIEHFNEIGETVRVRDIAYSLLSRMFSDGATAYRCLFGEDGYEEYANDEMRNKLDDYMTQEGYIRSFSTDADTGGISFEENKSALTKMISDIEHDMEDGLIEKKDGYARIADIRYKLNDKFKVEEAQKDKMVIVEKKYNHICERFRCECYLPTKEDLMEMYNLVEKK